MYEERFKKLFEDLIDNISVLNFSFVAEVNKSMLLILLLLIFVLYFFEAILFKFKINVNLFFRGFKKVLQLIGNSVR